LLVVKVVGIGGQGVVYLSWLLGYAAMLRGYYTSVHNSYGAEVRGGTVTSNIVISEDKEYNPYTLKTDILLILHNFGWKILNQVRPDVIIADDEVAYVKKAPQNVIWRPFSRLANERKLNMNMIALGYLIRHINMINLKDLIEAIKRRGGDVEKNIKAVKIGYSL